ncbi:MAG: aldehyde dehydrogenase family protein [Peptococcaceae bacterium]|jgi:acyl-CoA reductase-like NAD-dependent aldehyde dehydrogenase|nr:aldehyde dehydrogenase family protein [Peptococcaceae bacterium]
MYTAKMWIGGEWVDAVSGKTITTVNPATEEKFATVPLAGDEDVDKAVKAARVAFKVWSKLPPIARSGILFQMAAALRAEAEELSQIHSQEHGTPISDARFMCGVIAPGLLEYAAGASRTIMGEQIPMDPDTISYLKRDAMGVAGLIIPWNVPVLVTCAKMGPAISVGNTCVIKPPSVNSYTVLKLAEIFSKVKDLPPGVVNVITGPGGAVGNAIASHPGVDCLGFTGSSDTGKAILKAASQTVKKCSMELGGKNPVLVMADADLDACVNTHTGMQFNNSGQHCSSPGRYYVHEKVYDQFIEKMIAAANRSIVGDPSDDKTTMGPMASEEHYNKVTALIKSGVAEGAKIVAGAEKPANLNKGYYIMPTVFADATHDMRIAREEIFGPVSVVIKFKEGDDFVQLANDSRYGLCASIWTKDVGKGMQIMNELETGNVFINCHTLTGEQPWGSNVKDSGLGREGAVQGILDFTDLKMVTIRFGNSVPSGHH